jgi:hypothetical protein
MISSILPSHDADTIALDFGVFIAKRAKRYRTSQTAIIAALVPLIATGPVLSRTMSITPSQPSPASQAPAARTSPVPVAVQAGEVPVAASADHSDIVIPISTEIDRQPTSAAEVTTPDANTHGQTGTADQRARSQVPASAKAVAKEVGQSEQEAAVEPPVDTPSPLPGDPADGADIPPNRAPTPSAAFSPGTPSREDQMRALFADGKQPTAREAYEALGYSGPGPASKLAAKLGLTFRKVSAEELRAHGQAARTKQQEMYRAKRATTTKALKSSPAEPQEPVERAGPPTPRPEPKQPPATTPAEPFDDDEPAPVIRRVMKAPTGRFYLRDKVTGNYLHQSLQACPTGPGPLMTSDRKWAWYDTMERYRGAKKLWPALDEMRKEAAVQA